MWWQSTPVQKTERCVDQRIPVDDLILPGVLLMQRPDSCVDVSGDCAAGRCIEIRGDCRENDATDRCCVGDETVEVAERSAVPASLNGVVGAEVLDHCRDWSVVS